MKFISDEPPCKVANLLVASACKVKSARRREVLSGVARLFHVSNFDLLKDELVQLEPEMLLLDYDLPKLNGVCGVSELRRLSPKTNIVVFYENASDEDEWSLFKVGVRGCCSTDIESSSLKMMVEAVSNGELWIRRKFLHRLLEQLEKKQSKEADSNELLSDIRSLFDQLTDREYEIATMVGSGGSNKEIAYSLAITERTVKAHLTNIFYKLGVSDRLNVALLLLTPTRF